MFYIVANLIIPRALYSEIHLHLVQSLGLSLISCLFIP